MPITVKYVKNKKTKQSSTALQKSPPLKAVPGLKSKVTSLFCDWLAVTIPIKDKALQDYIIKNMKHCDAKSAKHYKYKLNIPINEQSLEHLNYIHDTTNYIRVWVKPKNENYNFIKIEFNPSKIDLELVPEFIGTLVAPNTTYQKLMEQAKITRIDLSVDVIGLQIEDAMFYVGYKTQTEILNYHHIKGKSGRVEKLGASTSENQWVFYDKRAELKGKAKVISDPLTRIEYRLTPKNLMIKDLYNLKNPFKKLKIYSFSYANHSNDIAFRGVVRLAKYEGLTNAIKNIITANYERKKYTKILNDSCTVHWWDSEKVWEQLPSVIKDILQDY